MERLVSNRKELRKALEYGLLQSLELEESLSGREEEAERDTQKPKTFIIESNCKVDEITRYKTDMEFKSTDDPTLLNVLVHHGVTPSVFYLDIQDPRFWIIHTTEYSKAMTDAVFKMVEDSGSRLDFPWFSSDSLEYIRSFGMDTGFGLSFEQRFADEEDAPDLKVRFWGRNVPEFLEGLRKIQGINPLVSLHSIGVDHRSEAGYVREQITRYGKFTVFKGNDIDDHFHLVRVVLDYYRTLLDNIEQNYRLHYEHLGNRAALHGNYSVIKFETEIPDLPRFADILTSSRIPFRIWGLWKEIESDLILIKAVDLHTMQRFDLELAPYELRVFLSPESCGNVLARLFTNIQSSFDSRCQLIGDSDESLIRPHTPS